MNSFLPYLIIILALALILGPIMMLQPTAGQRKRAKLRAMAAKQGIKVQADGDTSGINYFLPWPEAVEYEQAWRLQKQSYEHGAHFFKAWDFVDTTMHFDAQTRQSIERLLLEAEWLSEVGANAIGVFIRWDERLSGQLPQVAMDKVERTLIQLKGALSGALPEVLPDASV